MTEQEFTEVLKHWNSKKILTHTERKQGLIPCVKMALSKYSIGEIKIGIDHYSAMFFDPAYIYCNYKWDLLRMLYENTLDEFLNKGDKWLKYCQFKEKQIHSRQETDLKTMDYKEYVKTDHWQQFRIKAIEYAGHACQLCGAKDAVLQVHHKTYVNRGCETLNDVDVLCRACHDLQHYNQGDYLYRRYANIK